MEFSIKSGNPEKLSTPCIAVAVYAQNKLSSSAQALDKASRGFLSEVLQRGDMKGKLGATLLLYRVPGVTAERVLLVGSGAEAEVHDREFRECMLTVAHEVLPDLGRIPVRTTAATEAVDAALERAIDRALERRREDGIWARVLRWLLA